MPYWLNITLFINWLTKKLLYYDYHDIYGLRVVKNITIDKLNLLTLSIIKLIHLMLYFLLAHILRFIFIKITKKYNIVR